MLSVIKPNVVMLSVMAPSDDSALVKEAFTQARTSYLMLLWRFEKDTKFPIVNRPNQLPVSGDRWQSGSRICFIKSV
jgi:hypothetical protein